MQRGADDRRSLLLLLGVAVVASLAVLFAGLKGTLVDQHGFRQTQTAIAVYWMLRGSSWLNYETPVMGTGWSIPFEFPLYQWIVACLVRATGLPLVVGGRLVSYVWLIFSLWPTAYLFRSYRLPDRSWLVYAILLLLAPVYLFWGRTFLIETQALALSIATMALLRAYFTERRVIWAIGAMLCHVAAALTKITTDFLFLILMGMMTIEAVMRARGSRQRVTIALTALIVVLPGLAAFNIWNHHADALKAENISGIYYQSTSPSMITWNFGTLDQRFSTSMIKAVFRSVADVLGYLSPIILPVLGYLAYRQSGTDSPDTRRGLILAAILVAVWALPFEVLTNLYIVHNYYQAANAALLVAATAIVLGCVRARLSPTIFMLLLATILVSQLLRFSITFAPSMVHGFFEKDRRLGTAIRDTTPPGSAFVATGLGSDWAPTVPFYAERKALMIVANQPIGTIRDLAASPRAHLGGLPLAAVLRCPNSPAENDLVASRSLDQLVAGMQEQHAEDCRLFTVRPRPSITSTATR